MLSASATEVRTGHEAAVAAFAQGLAALGDEGFVQTNRTGTISFITPKGARLLGVEGAAEGKSLSAYIAGHDVPGLRSFLERPARFAETERPSIVLHTAGGSADIALFAQGQAGIITGYFGLVRARQATPMLPGVTVDPDPGLL